MDLPRTNSVASPPAYSSGGTPGYFSEAEKTKVSAQALNHVFRELLGILEGLGGTIDPENDQQIAPLLLARIAGATPEVVEATKVGSYYYATAQGPITRIKCYTVAEGDVLALTPPPGAIPLSVLAYAFEDRIWVEIGIAADKVSILFHGLVGAWTAAYVVVVWGTAP